MSLLRVLQDKSITRIGGEKSLLIDVRIICATNKDLRVEIAHGNFREDLYYRLNVISISLPPLREHREDIPLLFKTFYERTCKKLGVEIAQVDPEVILRLQQYDWPGNMREFQNAVEKMVNIPYQHHIEVNSLPDEIMNAFEHHSPIPPAPHHGPVSFREQRARIKEELAEQERKEILELLSRNRGTSARPPAPWDCPGHPSIASWGSPSRSEGKDCLVPHQKSYIPFTV